MVFIHGGEMEQWLDDGLYMYDTEARLWEDVPTQYNPSARYAHTFVGVADISGFLFGGETLFGKSNELFELDITTSPPRWIQHSLASSLLLHHVPDDLCLQ